MNLLPHSLTHAVEKCVTTTKNDVLVEVLSDVSVALLDRIIAVLVDTLKVKASDLWAEHYFCGSKPLVSDEDLSAVWELIVLFTCV